MQDELNKPKNWRLYCSEMIGTAFLVFVGLSIVTFMFGTGTPMAHVIPNEALRRLVTGFLFGTVGALIALSPVGKVSGAHINPAVSIGFSFMGKLRPSVAFGYVVAQLIGALLGSIPLLAWGAMGKSIAFGATAPGHGYSTIAALLGEVLTTFLMVALLTVFLGFREIRPFTPALFPPLYAVMVCLEAPLSGTSTNPARSFGPAVISGTWDAWWIYWLGPILGMLIAIIACSRLAHRIQVAKLYYFDSDRGDFLKNRKGRLASTTGT